MATKELNFIQTSIKGCYVDETIMKNLRIGNNKIKNLNIAMESFIFKQTVSSRCKIPKLYETREYGIFAKKLLTKGQAMDIGQEGFIVVKIMKFIIIMKI